ncbi:MAG: DUF2147 domain-containing protein [Candidatus Hydrogenedentes bacterium]|nr:DUF2147 domain-containing protein [Candidatus Hydrogenedentota bacterium]
MRKLFVAGLALALVLGVAHAETKADDVVGHWLTDGGGSKIEVKKEGEKYNGKIVWLKEPNQEPGSPEPGQPKRDAKNPDPAKQKDPIVGLALLKDFTWDGAGNWSGGTIYDPESGKTYKCTMKLKDEKTLDVRGYIGVPAFGRSTVWTRAEPEKAAAATVSAPAGTAPATAAPADQTATK